MEGEQKIIFLVALRFISFALRFISCECYIILSVMHHCKLDNSQVLSSYTNPRAYTIMAIYLFTVIRSASNNSYCTVIRAIVYYQSHINYVFWPLNKLQVKVLSLRILLLLWCRAVAVGGGAVRGTCSYKQTPLIYIHSPI